MPTIVRKIERMAAVGVGGVEYEHAIRPGRRSGAWIRFQAHEVPPYQGPSAMFECERTRRGWKVLRQVDG